MLAKKAIDLFSSFPPTENFLKKDTVLTTITTTTTIIILTYFLFH